MEALKKAKKYENFLQSCNLQDVQRAVNEVVKIYKSHQEEIEKKCKDQDFKDVNGLDFNEWAYTQEIKIEELYNELKSRYHDLHFDKYQFNAY